MSLPIKVSYETKLEDLVAFNEYHARHSPSIRRLLQLFVGAICVLTALALFVMYRQDDGLRGISVFVTTVPVLMVVTLTLLLFPRALRSMVRRQFSEGTNRSIIGPRTLVLTDQGLSEQSSAGELQTKWQSVERVASNDRYLFIYLSSVSAHVIPRDAFGAPEQLEQFLTAIEQQRARVSHA